MSIKTDLPTDHRNNNGGGGSGGNNNNSTSHATANNISDVEMATTTARPDHQQEQHLPLLSTSSSSSSTNNSPSQRSMSPLPHGIHPQSHNQHPSSVVSSPSPTTTTMTTMTMTNTTTNKHNEQQQQQGGHHSPSSTTTSKATASSTTTTTTTNSNSKVISSCLLYSFCSVSMVLTNKSLASSYNHYLTNSDGDLNILLVVFQAVVAVACVEVCRYLQLVDYPNFNVRTARLWAPVNILFCAMLFTGMASLRYNSVPMVTIFKNVTNILVTVGDWYCFGQVPEVLVVVAFAVMLGGAVAAAWNDIYVTSRGLFWMAANCCSTAAYVLYLKFATKTVKLSKFGMVFYNNVLCTCFLLPVATSMGQVQVLWHTPALHTSDYVVKNAFAGLVGFFLNFASLTCVAATGPTTYAIIGSLNKVPVAMLGYVLFDNVITTETWFFISVSMAGGFLYSYAKIQAGRKKARHESHDVRDKQ